MNVKNSSQNTVKKYEELTFTDDFMFCKVMQNNPDLCKHLIELIIGKKITMITYPDTQKAIEITADGKGIRMDVYVEGDEGTIYDIEMQTSMLSNLNKRARYYQGMIDLNTIERGADYKELRKTYIIFLCKFDPFGQARIKYTFMRTCQEDYRIKLGDDAWNQKEACYRSGKRTQCRRFCGRSQPYDCYDVEISRKQCIKCRKSPDSCIIHACCKRIRNTEFQAERLLGGKREI